MPPDKDIPLRRKRVQCLCGLRCLSRLPAWIQRNVSVPTTSSDSPSAPAPWPLRGPSCLRRPAIAIARWRPSKTGPMRSISGSRGASTPGPERPTSPSSRVAELMTFLHRRGVKGYVTLNTLVFPERTGRGGTDHPASGRGRGRRRPGAGLGRGPTGPRHRPETADARLDANDAHQRRVHRARPGRWASSGWCWPASCRSTRSAKIHRQTDVAAGGLRARGAVRGLFRASASPANRSAAAAPTAASVPRPAA